MKLRRPQNEPGDGPKIRWPRGIIQLAALRGFEVVVQEVNDAALDAGMTRVDDLFRKAVERRLSI